MITPENVKFCFDNLTEKQIRECFESDPRKDYILFELHIFNVGSYPSIEAHEYSEEIETEAQDNGQVFCDFDTFLQLFKESESLNPWLIQQL